MIIDKNLNPEELRREAIVILNTHLGPLNTYRFLAQISHAGENYLTLQKRLFNSKNVDELYNVAKEHWNTRKKSP